MDAELQERLGRVKTLLAGAKHMAIATVNADGSPHNTPLFFAFNADMSRLYWCSSPKSVHSQNIARAGQLFAVIYDSAVGGGLFIKATDAAEISLQELDLAIEACNVRRQLFGAPVLDSKNYVGDSTQRIYGTTPQEFSINMSHKNAQGQIIRDDRYLISAKELL